MADAGVRKFVEGDREAVQDVCYRTGFMGDSAGVYWRHRQSFVDIWVSPYLDQVPESVYVATVDGAVVGYLTGCVDTASGPNIDDIMMAQIRKHKLLFRSGTAGFFLRAVVDGVRDKQGAKGELHDERWPSHLHVNLLPEARGTGLGRSLMERWFEHLREVESSGCHLGTLAENVRAVAFFAKMGFKAYGEPAPIAGMRGSNGGRMHQQFMVWDV